MPSARVDLSDWVIHFVHRRNPDNDPCELFETDRDFPYHANSQLNDRYCVWEGRDREYPMESDAGPLAVILKILDDGHLRASWSFRGGRATIYRPRAAVCFTEMPLHALLHYAAVRKDESNVDVYGVCLLKRELFAAGARPVIYGLTSEHKECGERRWPRILDDACGISTDEQYRYVSMNLSGGKFVDWSHEREWRWCDSKDQSTTPGLPIWLADEPISFSQALILVSERREAELLLDKLKELYDSEYSNFDDHYNKEVLKNTRIVVLEDVLAAASAYSSGTIRIDDIPVARHLAFDIPEPSPELIVKMQNAIELATIAGKNASAKFRETYGSSPMGAFGFAHVMVGGNRSSVTEAMIRLGAAKPIGGVGYTLWELSWLGSSTGIIDEAEAAADAVVAVLDKEFPQSTFWVRTRLD